MKLYGRHWKKVEAYVGTRSGTQIRSHAQKHFLKSDAKELSSGEEIKKIDNEESKKEEEIIPIPTENELKIPEIFPVQIDNEEFELTQLRNHIDLMVNEADKTKRIFSSEGDLRILENKCKEIRQKLYQLMPRIILSNSLIRNYRTKFDKEMVGNFTGYSNM